MAFTIRTATIQDYESMVAVMLECDLHHAEHLPDIFCPPGAGSPSADAHLARPIEYIEELLHDPATTILVAELTDQGQAGQIVGAIIVMLRDTPQLPFMVRRRIAIVDLVSVRKEQRGSGIGRALMAAAETWARGMGAVTIELNVFVFNQNAVHLYEAMGYAPISQRMSKKIS